MKRRSITLALCSLRFTATLVAAEPEVFFGTQKIPVQEQVVRGKRACWYAWFPVTVAGQVRVKLPQAPAQWSVSPPRAEGPAVLEGSTISLSVEKPSYHVMQMDGERLFLLADPPPPQAPKDGWDVTAADYGADATGKTDSTPALQKACDVAAQHSSSVTLVFPPGTYRTTGITVSGRTSLFFAPGSVLVGSGDLATHPAYLAKKGKTAISSLILVKAAKHCRIYGQGVLDARGYDLAGDAQDIETVGVKMRCLTVEDSEDVTVEDLLCKNSTSWSVPFFHSKNVTARRIKVINEIGVLKHSDGINLCAVQKGLVEDCLVFSTDDAFCAKGHEGGPCEDLHFRRLIALSGTRGLKCGQQAYGPMRRVLFEDIHVVHTRDGIDLMHWDGLGSWTDITFRNIHVENCERRSLTATVREGGSINGLTFENITFRQARPGFFRGKDDAQSIRGLHFSHITLGGLQLKDLGSSGLETNRFVYDVEIK